MMGEETLADFEEAVDGRVLDLGCRQSSRQSSSARVLVYVRTQDRDARLIEFCPVEPFASEFSERGYRTHDTACAD